MKLDLGEPVNIVWDNVDALFWVCLQDTVSDSLLNGDLWDSLEARLRDSLTVGLWDDLRESLKEDV